MSYLLFLCFALFGSVVLAQNQFQNDGDDGSYNADKYEKPYEYNNALHLEPQQGYQQPQSYQPQAYQPQPQAYQPQPQAYQPQSQAYQPQPQVYQQPQQSYRQPQQPVYQPQQISYRSTTSSPHRVFPPGKLSLNRSPDGYSYSFSST